MDVSWSTRVALCVAFFAALAAVDYWRKGSDSVRWREYLFLFFSAAVLAVALYG
jgi:hypothetical protein